LKLIVGLGNPGRRYAHTRHNVGFEVVNVFAKRHHVRVGQRMCRSVVGQTFVGDEEVFLAKPHTFMNLSGEAVAQLCARFRIAPSDLILIYDDLNLPMGKLRIRPQGSSGGHKGMISIINRLHTDEFPRLRVGIGQAEGETVAYVLNKFRRDELHAVRAAVNRAAEALESIVLEGVEAAMNKFN